jgi:glycosyltransferase involved in cell wall biosynthesis
MKVAYLINQYPQISHTFIRNEIQELERQGIAVSRFAVRGWDAEIKDDADRAEREVTTYLLKRGGLPLIGSTAALLLRHPLRFLKALKQTIRAGRASDRGLIVNLVYLAEACLLTRHLARGGIGHIHCHFGTNPATLGMLCAILGGVKFSFTVHGPEEFDTHRQIGLADKGRWATFVVAISHFGRSQLYRFLDRQDWDKVAIVHCGLSADFLDTPFVPPPPRPELVSIGRLSEQKGQVVLIRACRLLKDRAIAFKLTVIGDGELRPLIEREIAESGLGDLVHLAGWKSGGEIRELLAASRAMVLPSFAEGLPVVIMEAMALGRPVISTYVAGIPELVREGQEGFLVPASDADQLADAMAKVLALDVDELARMGRSAKERVRERHAIACEAGKLATLFRAHQAGAAS